MTAQLPVDMLFVPVSKQDAEHAGGVDCLTPKSAADVQEAKARVLKSAICMHN